MKKQSMRGSRKLKIMMPLMVILFGIVIYQYGYLGTQRDISSIKEEQEMKTEILEKYITRISEIPNLERDIVSLRLIRDSYNTEMIEGETYSIASASLQDMVREIITDKDGKVDGGRMGQPGDLGKFKEINVNIKGTMPDVKALGEALYAIESHTPFLLVRDLDVSIRNYKEPREITLKLNVSAILNEK